MFPQNPTRITLHLLHSRNGHFDFLRRRDWQPP
jgi:hypothetical protein